VESPSSVKTGETFHVAAKIDAGSPPAIAYHWDFGDGTGAEGAKASHVYTKAGDYQVRLKIYGVDGAEAEKNFRVKVTGVLRAFPNMTDNRRLVEPTEH
jgi:chitodextrinase